MHDRASVPRGLWAIVFAGAIARAGIRLAGGADAFLTNGYTFYLGLAGNFLAGNGLCYGPGESCASRLPVYPLFLAGFMRAGALYPGVVIAQSIIGAAVAWLAWRIAAETLGPRVALLAAVATAFNPYALIHDTSLQDTVILDLLVAASLTLMLAALRTRRSHLWWTAGITLALAVLTNARVALLVPFAIVWAASAGGSPGRDRLRAAMAVAIPIVLMVGGWTARNWQLVGAPVLTTEAGRSLYFGNNPWTFSHFPAASIDLTADEFLQMPPEVYRSLERVEEHEVEKDNLYRHLALEYAAANPGAVAWGAVRKLWVVVSAELSPARGPIVQWSYRVVFLAAHVLALVGIWSSRYNWRVHALLWGLLVSFAITTAVFWAHTSHTSYLDPILFAYTGAGWLRIVDRG